MQAEGSNVKPKRERHVKVALKGCDHIYYSTRSDGTKVYEVRYPKNSAGKRPFEVVGTRLDQAKARAHQIHGDHAPEIVSLDTRLAEVIEDWKKTRDMKPRSAASFDANIRLHIEPTLGRVKVREITKQRITLWLAGLRRADGRPGDLSNGTKRLLLATLDILLTHAVEIGALASVPKLDRKRKPKQGDNRKRILTHDEEALLLAYCGSRPWMQPIIKVALHQALRLGEVAALRWDDVDFGRSKLTVRHTASKLDGSLGTPKGGKVATIDLMPAPKAALLDLRLEATDGFIFTNTLGGQRQLRDIQRAFSAAVKRAGIRESDDGRVSFHTLRHTAISRLANCPGVTLAFVKSFARHAALATTEGYIHPIENPSVTEAAASALAGATAQAV